MKQILAIFEKVVLYAVIFMLMVVILVSTVELGFLLFQDLRAPPLGLVSITQLLDLFGFFLLILIGIELLESIKAYLSDHVIHVEIVLEVALIAIARKVIVLEIETYSGIIVLGIAALIVATGFALYLLRRVRFDRSDKLDLVGAPEPSGSV